jgi:hypothetical protein
VTSILGSSALVYKQFATQRNVMSVACARAVALDPAGKFTDPMALLNQERYKSGGVLWLYSYFKKCQTDANGDFALDICWQYEDGTGKAAFMDYPYSGNWLSNTRK